MTLFGMRLRIHPLAPIMLALGMAFSGIRTLLPALIALGIHEGAHLFCAIRLNAKVDEIELMPFGAAIRLYSLWETSPWKLLIISLSGPVANILFASLISLAIHLHPPIAFHSFSLLQSNLAIALVNLLPALPLDGGRATCALISLKIGNRKAVSFGVWMGKALAIALAAFFLYRFFKTGAFELTLLLSSIYIFAAGDMEKRQSEGASLRSLLLSSPFPVSPQPARLIAVSESTPVYEAAKLVRPGERAFFAVEDVFGNLIGILTQTQIAEALSANRFAGMKSLLPTEASGSESASDLCLP